MLQYFTNSSSNVFSKQATILDLDAYRGIVLVEQKRMLILGLVLKSCNILTSRKLQQA
jgi:hypothetical protein